MGAQAPSKAVDISVSVRRFSLGFLSRATTVEARIGRRRVAHAHIARAYRWWLWLDTWWIVDLYTHPDHRRKGLARRLMALAETHAAEMNGESLTLEVRGANTDAIAMYASLAYERAGIRPAYYQDGEDAIIMTKRIPNEE